MYEAYRNRNSNKVINNLASCRKLEHQHELVLHTSYSVQCVKCNQLGGGGVSSIFMGRYTSIHDIHTFAFHNELKVLAKHSK